LKNNQNRANFWACTRLIFVALDVEVYVDLDTQPLVVLVELEQ
jgi:hypothetical protein